MVAALASSSSAMMASAWFFCAVDAVANSKAASLAALPIFVKSTLLPSISILE
jgi:hypothetical protein